jgi:hypothetical protein
LTITSGAAAVAMISKSLPHEKLDQARPGAERA